MADVITLKDGSVITIFQPEDFQELIDQYLGYDAAKYFQLLVENCETWIEEAEKETNSDLRSCEISFEFNINNQI